ncbi:hypothetical protein ZOSMA_205G00420 [Zostera marina]|uniref:Uncharacterized protein n=1 Tax=Zostera marina TaxID=29655 RepID=A0A0K9PNQ6_ZOSMR|nr:hypothetical protein ZOSMA_205G00420 [Zostera marina]
MVNVVNTVKETKVLDQMISPDPNPKAFYPTKLGKVWI